MYCLSVPRKVQLDVYHTQIWPSDHDIISYQVSDLILTTCILQDIRTVDIASEWLIVMAFGNGTEGNELTLIILKLSSFLSSLLLQEFICHLIKKEFLVKQVRFLHSFGL